MSFSSFPKDTLPIRAVLVDVLRRRSENQGHRPAYAFLPDDNGQAEQVITYGELDLKARAIGAMLQGQKARGERVLLVFPSGLEFICAMYGCLYAGAIPVPVHPPDPARIHRTLPRLEAIAGDSEARFALTTQMIHSVSEPILALAPKLKKLKWITSDTVPDTLVEAWKDPKLQGQDIAFLQYTSGSTSTPKGVMVTFDNLCHDSEARYHLEKKPQIRLGVYWLPIHHDMGLIEGIFNGLFNGHPNVILSPFTFLKNPFRWLQAVSQFQATNTAAPNFAFDLCVRKVSEEQRAQLDLSHWTRIYNGAEPLRVETLKRFSQYFAPAGLRPEAMLPCYGLAEATLIGTGEKVENPPAFRFVDRKILQNKQVKMVDPDHEDSQPVVGCGSPILGRKIAIVDPDTLEECSSNRVGEIWLAGPNIAKGYWKKPEVTRNIFQARIKNTHNGSFLRTGDLGFFDGEELFVTGRLKDMIIVGGQNHYANDIEFTVEKCHPVLRPGCVAAFSVDKENEERLVVVQEVDSRHGFDVEDVIKTIRRAVIHYHDILVRDVVLIRPRTIFKTSSGKIQRHACRAAYLDGTLSEYKIQKTEVG